jgi:hypothetical protein
MSWLFSRALAEEFSAGNCSDGEPYAQLNVMPTQHKFWRNDRMIEFSTLSKFGLTLRLLTDQHGVELLTWFLEGFRAKTSALLERERVFPEREADYGLNSGVSFAKFNRDLRIWKTAQHSLFEDLELSLATWPRWGSMRNGECFHAQMSAGFIYEKGSGFSVPTPRSCSAMAARITESTAAPHRPAQIPEFRNSVGETFPADAGRERGKRSKQKEIYRFTRFPWGEDVRGIEDLRKRSDLPEPLIRRIGDDVAFGVDRLKAIGNGQVSRVAAAAFRLLAGKS